jgi:ADP-heptose:LPS heptosyltransferase
MDGRRSLSLKMLSELQQVEGVIFYSLQKGAAQRELQEWDGEITDLSDELHDFEDTAAVVSNLDLVITVDTSVAHLAGASGKPVWMLSRFDACWRWGTEGQQTPWYPTMRIYRQESYGDWSVPLRRLVDDLQSWRSARG